MYDGKTHAFQLSQTVGQTMGPVRWPPGPRGRTWETFFGTKGFLNVRPVLFDRLSCILDSAHLIDGRCFPSAPISWISRHLSSTRTPSLRTFRTCSEGIGLFYTWFNFLGLFLVCWIKLYFRTVKIEDWSAFLGSQLTKTYDIGKNIWMLIHVCWKVIPELFL